MRKASSGLSSMNKQQNNSASYDSNTATPKKQPKNNQSTPIKNSAGNGPSSGNKKNQNNKKTPNSQKNLNLSWNGSNSLNSNGKISGHGAQPKYAGAQFQTAPLPSQLPSIPSTWVSSSFHSNNTPSSKPAAFLGSPGSTPGTMRDQSPSRNMSRVEQPSIPQPSIPAMNMNPAPSLPSSEPYFYSHPLHNVSMHYPVAHQQPPQFVIQGPVIYDQQNQLKNHDIYKDQQHSSQPLLAPQPGLHYHDQQIHGYPPHNSVNTFQQHSQAFYIPSNSAPSSSMNSLAKPDYRDGNDLLSKNLKNVLGL